MDSGINWIRLKIDLQPGWDPSNTELLALVRAFEREIGRFSQVKKVYLEDYQIDRRVEKEEGAIP